MTRLLRFAVVAIAAATLAVSSPAHAACDPTSPAVIFRNLVTAHHDVTQVVVYRTDDRSRETYWPQGDGSVIVRYRFAEYTDAAGHVICPRVRLTRHFTRHDFYAVTLQYRLDHAHAVTVTHRDGTVETFTNPDQTVTPLCQGVTAP